MNFKEHPLGLNKPNPSPATSIEADLQRALSDLCTGFLTGARGFLSSRRQAPKGYTSFALSMPADVISQIYTTIGQYECETGGILGARPGSALVERFHFDSTAERRPDCYPVDWARLNRVIAEQWRSMGISLMGLVHSHAEHHCRPSGGDIDYGAWILNQHPELSIFWMLIVTPVRQTGCFQLAAFPVQRSKSYSDLNGTVIQITPPRDPVAHVHPHVVPFVGHSVAQVQILPEPREAGFIDRFFQAEAFPGNPSPEARSRFRSMAGVASPSMSPPANSQNASAIGSRPDAHTTFGPVRISVRQTSVSPDGNRTGCALCDRVNDPSATRRCFGCGRPVCRSCSWTSVHVETICVVCNPFIHMIGPVCSLVWMIRGAWVRRINPCLIKHWISFSRRRGSRRNNGTRRQHS
mgnify:CR=1 FL=1